MYRLNSCLITAGHLFARFIATTCASTYRKRLNQPVRYVFYVPSFDRRVMVPISFNRPVMPPNPKPMNNNYKRKILPPELLSENVVKLTCDSAADGGVCDVYLIGTRHDSKESCEEVKAVINFLKPQVVFLELCSRRVPVLVPQDLKVPTIGEMVEMWKKKQNLVGILCSRFLAKIEGRDSEFQAAYEEAMKYGGKVVLGDLPLKVTLRKIWAKKPLWQITKFLYSLLFPDAFLPSPEARSRTLKKMGHVEMLKLENQELCKHFPTLMETLMHERDQFMSASLLRIASEHNSVVAVVGKRHLPGMKTNWKQQPIDVVQVTQLLIMPTEKNTASVRKILGTIGVTVAGVAIISGLYFYKK